MSCRLPFFVENYFQFMDENIDRFCDDQFKLRELIMRSFENDDIYVDEEQARKYFSLARYLDFETIEWQEFILGLHLWEKNKFTKMERLGVLYG